MAMKSSVAADRPVNHALQFTRTRLLTDGICSSEVYVGTSDPHTNQTTSYWVVRIVTEIDLLRDLYKRGDFL